jgi:hypothetical protein
MRKQHGRRALGVLALAAFTVAGAEGSLIWDGDVSNGTGVFKGFGGEGNCGTGSITPFNDPQRGSVWRYNKPASSPRCENHGIAVNGSGYAFQNDRTYYLGWFSKLSTNANNNANFQWKSYEQHIQNWPVVLKLISGRVTMIQRQPGNQVHTIWSAPLSANVWTHWVIGLHLSDDTLGGWVELYMNGVQQRFNNGQLRWACRLFDGGHVCPKWGIYGGSGTAMNNYVDGLKVGTTYGDVAGVGPTPTATPTSTPTPTPTRTPTPTPTPVGGFIEITPAGSAVTASANDGNVPGNSVDNSLSTRWSADGDGQWIRFNLGARRRVSHVKIAFYRGNVRQERFDIQASDNGIDWSPLLTSITNSGNSLQEETFDFGDVDAQYIRYLGHGNTANLWNSLTEFSIFAPVP